MLPTLSEIVSLRLCKDESVALISTATPHQAGKPPRRGMPSAFTLGLGLHLLALVDFSIMWLQRPHYIPPESVPQIPPWTLIIFWLKHVLCKYFLLLDLTFLKQGAYIHHFLLAPTPCCRA